MIPYTTQITCRQVFFFVTGNVSMILTLSSLPGTNKKPLIITLWANIATHLLVKIAQKKDENRFLMISTSKTSYSKLKYVIWANKWCSIILGYHQKCLLHS
jgi:hypothetical protein